jgi:hypothetical protein
MVLNRDLLETSKGNEFVEAIGLSEFLNAGFGLKHELRLVPEWIVDSCSGDYDMEDFQFLALREEVQSGWYEVSILLIKIVPRKVENCFGRQKRMLRKKWDIV